MKIKCPYCDTMFDDTLINCPNCGAASEGVKRTASSQPITIEQLQKWYQDRGLPPYETTRFFIGEDYRGPRAFGIYQDEATGNFVVYKNLTTGERKVRYEGTDEAYAVNELYMRLKEEIIQQKRSSLGKFNAAVSGKVGETANGKKKFLQPLKILLIMLLIMGVIMTAVILITNHSMSDSTIPTTGYYHYNDTDYYHATIFDDTDDWYYFDTDTDRWEHTYDELPSDLADDDKAKDFYYTPTWDSTTQTHDFDDPAVPFEQSEYAEQYNSAATAQPTTTGTTDTWDNDDDDNTYSWDNDTDTWDNGTTDFDTDW